MDYYFFFILTCKKPFIFPICFLPLQFVPSTPLPFQSLNKYYLFFFIFLLTPSLFPKTFFFYLKKTIFPFSRTLDPTFLLSFSTHLFPVKKKIHLQKKQQLYFLPHPFASRNFPCLKIFIFSYSISTLTFSYFFFQS